MRKFLILVGIGCFVPVCLASEKLSFTRRHWLKLCGTALVATPLLGVGVENLVTETDFQATKNFSSASPQSRWDVVVVGDSLSSSDGGAAGGILGGVQTIYDDRNRRNGSWVMGAQRSLFEELSAEGKAARVTNLAWSGSYVDGEALEISRTVANNLRAIRNLNDQVDTILDTGRFPVGEFPNIVLLWIGHNNMDWAWDLEEMSRPQDSDLYVQMMANRVSAQYEEKLLDLLGRAALEKKSTSIVVYGLFNFENAFSAREEAEVIRKKDPSQFPFFDLVPAGFPSMLPQHRTQTIKVGASTNRALKAMVERLNRTLDLKGKIQLRYSDALYDVPLNKARYLHSSDGFHLGREGHDIVADAVRHDLQTSKSFLNLP